MNNSKQNDCQSYRGFVASWFFPPNLSSEGIVAYKQLRNSKYNYDVCCSNSKLWGYDATMECDCENINVFSVNTDSLEEWVSFSIDLFEKNHAKCPYDFIMTRSMPPESILVGSAIKKKYPEIKWIASFGDPIASNPYTLSDTIFENPHIPDDRKEECLNYLKDNRFSDFKKMARADLANFELLTELKSLEDMAFDSADCIICNNYEQKKYMSDWHRNCQKISVIPHSFEPSLYKAVDNNNRDLSVVEFAFIGSSDHCRSLVPLVNALKILKDRKESQFDELSQSFGTVPAIQQIHVKIVGNHPVVLKDLVRNFLLEDTVEFIENVDYLTSLEYMSMADWLINIDAEFEWLKPTVFFAGKLADYLGSGKPILSLTDANSPADSITKGTQGVSLYSRKPEDIADCLESIVRNDSRPTINAVRYREYADRMSAQNVGAKLDRLIESVITDSSRNKNFTFGLPAWLTPSEYNGSPKILTVCVPTYNVESYLSRCLSSLVSSKYADYLDIVVVNDGSKDYSLQIAETFQSGYPGIIRVINKENGGHGSTINAAVSVALGKYFGVVDSDDWIDSDALDTILGSVLSDNIDVDLISTNYYQIDADSGETTPFIQDANAVYNQPYSFHDIDKSTAYYTLAGTFFRTSLLQDHNLHLHEKTFYVDVEYILYPIPYVETVYCFDIYLYRYFRGRMEQSVNTANMVKRYADHDRVIRSVIQFERNTQMDDSHREYIRNILAKVIYTQYAIGLLFDSDKERGFSRAREFDKFLFEQNSLLYRRVGRDAPHLRINRLRKYDFAADKISLIYDRPGFFKKAKTLAKSFITKFRHTKTGQIAIRVLKNTPFSRAKLWNRLAAATKESEEIN